MYIYILQQFYVTQSTYLHLYVDVHEIQMARYPCEWNVETDTH